MNFKSLLKSNLDRNKKSNEDNSDELFKHYYCKWKGVDEKGHPLNEPSSNVSIPKFYRKLPANDDMLRQKLREEARSTFLQCRNKELLSNDELKNLWSVLEENQSPPISEINGEMINYNDFLKVSKSVGEKYSNYLKPSIFCKLRQDDPYGRIAILHIFNYVMRKVWFYQTRIGLSLYDISGQGFLRDRDLESYILDLIPTLPQLASMEKSFYSFYVCTAVRKFSFFLDPLHTCKMKIQDLLSCTFLDDLLTLRDTDTTKEQQENNWFSASSALRVYGMYLNLDKDHDGMLSKENLSHYGMSTLTSVFIDRVFQECITFEGKMDYRTYLDFVLAMENKKDPQALNYFFKILDIDGKGYIDSFTINYFFRCIRQRIQEAEQVPVEINDEIFDMVKPVDPTRITLQDLINCGQGHVVISILIDLNAFWNYENRETNASDPSEEGTQV